MAIDFLATAIASGKVASNEIWMRRSKELSSIDANSEGVVTPYN